MKKILWLPAWYPNKTAPFDGDFIQRHAMAVSLYHAVRVIHVVRDKDGSITKNVKTERFRNGNLEEQIVYYYSPALRIGIADKMLSTLRYSRHYQDAIKSMIREEGIPACAHVHVAGKNGLIALWLKKKFNLPFVITEHWTVYLPGAVPAFNQLGRFFSKIWKQLMKETVGLSVVSHFLGEAMRTVQTGLDYTVIPNVVDTSIFFPAAKKESTVTRFIHISGLGYQKNPEAILQALALVKKANPLFSLAVFGPHNDALQAMTAQMELEKEIQFYNEVPQKELAAFLRQSDALILYSRYETFGCVLIEANACGVPAIVSDIPVLHEIIEEGVNGFFAAEGNPSALAQQLLQFMESRPPISGEAMAAMTKEKYSYEKIGRMFSVFYAGALKP